VDIVPPRVPLTLAAVCGWRRGGLFGYLGGGARVLAGGPSACWNLGYVPSDLAVPVARCWPSLIHCQELWWRHDQDDSLRGSSSESCFLRTG